MFRCDPCDADMEYESVSIEVSIDGKVITVDQPGWYCWCCRSSRHSAGDLFTLDQAIEAAVFG